MIYLIRNPSGYKLKQEAKYDHDLSTDMYVLFDGRYIKQSEMNKPIIFNMKLLMKDALAFDNMINNSTCLLINERTVEILKKLVPEEVQFFDAEIRCKDGVLTNYKLVNITQEVEGIDHEKSLYTWLGDPADKTISLQRLFVKKDCMNGYKIARLAEFSPHILATEEIKQAFESARVTGLRFMLPQDYYAEVLPYYAENSVWPRAME
jgi:hypothetical protein